MMLTFTHSILFFIVNVLVWRDSPGHHLLAINLKEQLGHPAEYLILWSINDRTLFRFKMTEIYMTK